MKRREPDLLTPWTRGGRAAAVILDPLLDALIAMRNREEMKSLLDDLCTPAESEAIADRWRVVPLLIKNTPYREIHERTGVSVTTIGRIARCLSFGSGGYRLAAQRIPGARKNGARKRG